MPNTGACCVILVRGRGMRGGIKGTATRRDAGGERERKADMYRKGRAGGGGVGVGEGRSGRDGDKKMLVS